MVLQLEDCVDFVQVLYPEPDVFFLLDVDMTSNDRKVLMLRTRISLLVAIKPKMRETQTKQEKGYLGPSQRLLHPGDTQKMIIESNDVGPF
jgi:hypothetical protein